MQSGNCWRSEAPRNDPFVYSETPRVVLCAPLAVLCPLAGKQEYEYLKKKKAEWKVGEVTSWPMLVSSLTGGGFTGHPNLGHKHKIK